MFEFEDYPFLDPNYQGGFPDGEPIDPEIPPYLDEEQQESLQEFNEAIEEWLDETYNNNPDEYPSLTTLENDFKNDLREGDEAAWAAMWEFAEYVYGQEDIKSDPFWSGVVTEAIAESIFGTSEGLIFDPATNTYSLDPNYTPPPEETDGEGEEEEDEDETFYDDDGDDDFEYYEDGDDEDPSGTVTIEDYEED